MKYIFLKNIDQPGPTYITCDMGNVIMIKPWNPYLKKLGSSIIMNQILKAKSEKK